jgi:hypothetical protein
MTDEQERALRRTLTERHGLDDEKTNVLIGVVRALVAANAAASPNDGSEGTP